MPEPQDVVIKGATIVDVRGERRADVHVAHGRIINVAPEIDPPSRARVLDGSSGYLMPAFVDLHTHLREPGGARAETVISGTRAAALGGYRCVVAMPNTVPAIDSVEAVEYVRSLAAGALCEVAISATITVGRLGERLSPFAELKAQGVRIFTDDGRGVQDEDLMRVAFAEARALGVLLAQHCEDEALARHGHMHQGEWSSRLGIPGQPTSAEATMVARDLRLSREVDAPIHFLHLSTNEAIELVRRAKAVGMKVTAEATPHHLALTHAEVASYDPTFKVNPPLRACDDVRAVRSAVIDRTIDAIATDHAPHPPETKDEPFDCAPPGMIGLETAFAVVYSELVAKHHLRVTDDPSSPALSMTDLVALFSVNPAAIAGVNGGARGGAIEVGADGDLVLFDPTARWQVEPTGGASRSRNTPFARFDLTGRVRHTLFRGEPVVIDATAQR